MFTPESLDHLHVIERKYHRLLRQAIDEQLRYAQAQATRFRYAAAGG